MNKTIIININSIVFHIEEDAYEILRSYMIDIKKHFGNSDESREILEDIENRIAEMFSERIQTGRKEVINLDDVQEVITQMGRVSDFEGAEPSDDEEPVAPKFVEDEPQRFNFGKKLMRDSEDKLVAGVCSGLGHYFGIESRWLRLLLVLFFLVGGSGVLIYIVLWIVMPLAESRADKMAMRGEAPNLQNFKKSFDEDVRSFSDNFSGATETLGRGARTAGTMLGGCVGLIGKFIAWIMLITVGFGILGLLMFYVFNMLNLFGFETDIFFPPLQLLTNGEAQIAITFGFLSIVIPCIALFFVLVRVLFKTERFNSYVSLTLFATWLVAIIAVIYFCVYAAQDFREQSTINIKKDIQRQTEYHFTERDVRTLDANERDSLQSRFNINIDDQDLRNYLQSDISIVFEQIDSLQQPYIQYNYSAKGKTYKLAAERATNIKYAAVQEGEKFLFPSHFVLQKASLQRDQRVRVTVFLPIGAKVVLEEGMEYKVRELNYYDCRANYLDSDHQKFTEWTMTNSGLRCAIAAPVKDDEGKSDEE